MDNVQWTLTYISLCFVVFTKKAKFFDTFPNDVNILKKTKKKCIMHTIIVANVAKVDRLTTNKKKQKEKLNKEKKITSKKYGIMNSNLVAFCYSCVVVICLVLHYLFV